MTILLLDDYVSGLQVRKRDEWITVKPVPNAFIINIGNQIQALNKKNKLKDCEPNATTSSSQKHTIFANRIGSRWTSSGLQICESDMLYLVYKFADRMRSTHCPSSLQISYSFVNRTG